VSSSFINPLLGQQQWPNHSFVGMGLIIEQMIYSVNECDPCGDQHNIIELTIAGMQYRRIDAEISKILLQ
jgi:hypothetical protein